MSNTFNGTNVVSALVQKSSSNTSAVAQGGLSAPTTDDATMNDDTAKTASGLQGPSNVQPGSSRGITSGAAVGVGLAVVLVILALIFVGRRNRPGRADEGSLLKAGYTDDEDDEDLMLHANNNNNNTHINLSSSEHQQRLAHVVGDDDSSMVSSDYTSNHQDAVEVEPVYSSARRNRSLLDSTLEDDVMSDVDIDADDHVPYHSEHHWCSSPHCESCELKRQKGVMFIPTSEPLSGMIPRDARRSYESGNTVDL
jgi:hypothetical protein